MTANSGLYSSMIQRIHVPPDLIREQVWELGRKGPYFRYIEFPEEIESEMNKILGLEHFLGSPKYEQSLDTIYKGLEINKCHCSNRTLFEKGCQCGGI